MGEECKSPASGLQWGGLRRGGPPVKFRAVRAARAARQVAQRGIGGFHGEPGPRSSRPPNEPCPVLCLRLHRRPPPPTEGRTGQTMALPRPAGWAVMLLLALAAIPEALARG